MFILNFKYLKQILNQISIFKASRVTSPPPPKTILPAPLVCTRMCLVTYACVVYFLYVCMCVFIHICIFISSDFVFKRTQVTLSPSKYTSIARANYNCYACAYSCITGY